MKSQTGQKSLSTFGWIAIIPLICSIPPLVAQDRDERPEIVKALKYMDKAANAKDKKERNESLARLQSELMTVPKGLAPLKETRQALNQKIIQLFSDTRPEDRDDQPARRAMLYVLAQSLDDPAVRKLLLELLDRSHEQERKDILALVGVLSRTPANDFYDKADELARRGLIPPDRRAEVLSTLNKSRAETDVLKDVTTTSDKQTFVHAARALQNTYRRPDDFRIILPRIRELGLHKKYDKEGNGLYWIDEHLFHQYVGGATGDDLVLAMSLMSEHSEFTSPNTAAFAIKKLSSTDPKIRLLAARILTRAIDYHTVDGDAVAAALKAVLAKEADPTTRRGMQESLDEIARYLARKKEVMEEFEGRK